MSAAAIWAVYDIGAAPEAGRRADARNGLLDVALAPTFGQRGLKSDG